MTEKTIDILPLIIEGIRERKGRKITTVDMSDIDTAAARRFVICEGTSTQHVAAVADSIREYLLDKERIKPYNYDGYGNSQWIVIDYGDTLVHVFLPQTRRLYDLEDLWSDAVITDYPDED
ncbi:MAG: ribosome silencing factor [Bacteroides sp.]|nr:ribosome silencing factor [Bacteroides sp.]